MQNRRLLAVLGVSSVLLSSLAGTTATANEKHWPYHQLPATSFARVIGPHAADASFIINGRPITFEKTDVDLAGMEKQINATLKDAEETAKSNGKPVIVSTEPIDYLKNVKESLATLGNPHLRMSVGGDYVQVIYTPPFQRLGDADITLYDALASICARQHEYSSAYQNMAKSLERKREVFGPNSDEVAQQIVDIAALNEDSRNFNAAEKYYRQALDVVTTNHGPNSKEAAGVLMQLSHCLASSPANRAADADKEGRQAIAIMNSLGIKHVGYGLPMSANHSWGSVTQGVTGIISALAQDTSRRKADVDSMRQTLYNMIHEEEIAAKRKRDAEEAALREARQQKIYEENVKLLGKAPSVGGQKFYNAEPATAGFIAFFAGGEAEIGPSYAKVNRDAAAQVPKGLAGQWKQVQDMDSDGDEVINNIIKIVSTESGNQRVDTWKVDCSRDALGEAVLTQVTVEKPYPTYLRCKMKGIKIPPEVISEVTNFKPNPAAGGKNNELVPPPPPN